MAMIADAVVSWIIAELGTLAKEEVVMLLGVEDELKKLVKKVEKISDFLEDAERKRLQDPAVDRWLKEVRDIMFDADNIIDECRSEGEKLNSTSTASESVSLFTSIVSNFSEGESRHAIGEELESINGRLEEASKEISLLQLTSVRRTPYEKWGPQREKKWSRESSPVFDESDVMGIDDDTNILVEKLTEEKNKKIVTLAIWGAGGIGKTTLAQKVFNHHGIKSQFQIKIWVCVSQNFIEIDVLKQIIRSVDPERSCGERNSRAELDTLLMDSVRDKRFLLVLDDVWNGQLVWETLRAPLQSAKKNSRFLVTTRNQNVAKEMGAVYLHEVKQLSDENGWRMLCKNVFGDENAEDAEELRDVGTRIIQKCKGLPLAVKALGGILMTKEKNMREWEKVLVSQTWSFTELPDRVVMPALYMSYEDLPSHLKQCFLYCSLYPEDFEIGIQDLTRQWIAEGFVETNANLTMEELAEDYHRELVRRSLLDSCIEDGYCKMHDLLRALALFLTQQEHFSGDLQSLNPAANVKLRRLSIVGDQLSAFPNVIKEQKSLRTLLFNDISSVPVSIASADLGVQLKHLRVLHLCTRGYYVGYESLNQKLPGSIGNLIHLRYLNLSRNDFKELPESLQYLQNLQTLDLSGCWNLYQIPNGIMNLKNLRHLIMDGTNINKMSIGIGRLTNLQTLSPFWVNNCDGSQGQCGGSNMEELKSLSQLTSLSICDLGRISSSVEAERAELGNKRKLKVLKLVFFDRDNIQQPEEGEINRVEEVLEGLFPPSSLESLELSVFIGRKFPSWISGEYLKHLSKLVLTCCDQCEEFPMLGQLPQLQHLEIECADRVRSVGSEFYGGATTKAFPKLEILKFVGMDNWEEWEEWEGVGALTHLRKLFLSYCPKLKSLPKSLRHATALTKLEIGMLDSLWAIENLPSVTDLDLYECHTLECISDLLALKRLEITACPSLHDVKNLDSLEYLNLEDHYMKVLPEWLQQMTRLQRLEVTGKESLLMRMGSKDWPKIRHISHVYVHSLWGASTVLYTKSNPTLKTNLITENNADIVAAVAAAASSNSNNAVDSGI